MKLKVLVTGYPNSGTSFLCNLVVELGLSPGKNESLKSADAHNRYGYYENLVLRNFLWEFFKAKKLKMWDQATVAKKRTEVKELRLEKAPFPALAKIIDDELIEVYKDNKLPLYFEAFDPAIKIIVIERNANDVFRSPQKSGFSPMEVSYEKFFQAYEYYRHLCLKMSVARSVLFLNYEDFFSDFDGQVEKIKNFLNLSSNQNLKKIFKPRVSQKKSKSGYLVSFFKKHFQIFFR